MSHCNHFQPAPLSRRDMLTKCANGFGGLAHGRVPGVIALRQLPRHGQGAHPHGDALHFPR